MTIEDGVSNSHQVEPVLSRGRYDLAIWFKEGWEEGEEEGEEEDEEDWDRRGDGTMNWNEYQAVLCQHPAGKTAYNAGIANKHCAPCARAGHCPRVTLLTALYSPYRADFPQARRRGRDPLPGELVPFRAGPRHGRELARLRLLTRPFGAAGL